MKTKEELAEVSRNYRRNHPELVKKSRRKSYLSHKEDNTIRCR